MKKTPLFTLLLTLALGLLLGGLLAVPAMNAWQPVIPARAQGTPHEPTADEVNAIAKQLYCPVCENIPLDVCGTAACAQWRKLIREKLRLGWSEQQIKDYFVEQYGDRVLGTPPPRGMNWLVYIVPPVAILTGAYLLFRAMRMWSKQAPQAGLPDQPLTEPNDDYVRRLEEELKKR